jgi:hypothetical protein
MMAPVKMAMNAHDPAMTAMAAANSQQHGEKSMREGGANTYLDGMAPNTFLIAPNALFPATPLGGALHVESS